MRIISIHPVSLVCGTLGAGLLFLTMGMFAPGHDSSDGRTLLVQLEPRPDSLVRILEGDTFTVPRRKVLVIKTFAGSSSISGAVLSINGQAVFSVSTGEGPVELSLGVAARAGDTVTIAEDFPDPGNVAVALGFLADE